MLQQRRRTQRQYDTMLAKLSQHQQQAGNKAVASSYSYAQGGAGGDSYAEGADSYAASYGDAAASYASYGETEEAGEGSYGSYGAGALDGPVQQELPHGSDYAHQLDLVFEHLDLKGDGVVSLHEFRAGMLTHHQNVIESLLRPVFEEIDREGTGEISADEVIAALQKLGGVAISRAEAQALLDEFDLDGRGLLTFSEFAKMMSHESMESIPDSSLPKV